MRPDRAVAPVPFTTLRCKKKFRFVGDDGDAFGGECAFICKFFPACAAEVQPLGGVYVYAVLGLHNPALIEHLYRNDLFVRTYVVGEGELYGVRSAGQGLIMDRAGHIGLKREAVASVIVSAVDDKVSVPAGDRGLYGEFPGELRFAGE